MNPWVNSSTGEKVWTGKNEKDMPEGELQDLEDASGGAEKGRTWKRRR